MGRAGQGRAAPSRALVGARARAALGGLAGWESVQDWWQGQEGWQGGIQGWQDGRARRVGRMGVSAGLGGRMAG